MTLISFIVAISVLVTVHEWGHFWVARRLRIKVDTFAIGFGKPLIRWRDKQGTWFQLGYIPLGGYVKLLDSTVMSVTEEELPYAFDRQPPWRRILVAAAGPLANLLFAVVACWLMFIIGIQTVVPVIGDVLPDSVAQRAGLSSGMTITELNDRKVTGWREVISELLVAQGRSQPLTMTLQTSQGDTVRRQLDLATWQFNDQQQSVLADLGIEPYQPAMPAIISQVEPGGPAAQAGFKPGDRIVSVNDVSVDDLRQLVNEIRGSTAQVLHMRVVRDGQSLSFTVTPVLMSAPDGERLPRIGIQLTPGAWPDELLRKVRLDPVAATASAIQEVYRLTTLTGHMLIKLFTGQIHVQHVTGPIGIAQGAGMAASIGLAYYLAFLALVSVSLAVLNLLPIPILDGGHILFGVIEWLRGKPIPPGMVAISSKIGLLLVGGIILLAIYNDIGRLL
jgi:regulator of sigma E protease